MSASICAGIAFVDDGLFAQSAVNDDFLKSLRAARDEMEQLFQKGQAALQAGDYQLAKELFEKVSLKNRNYRNVQSKLREIEMLLEQDAYLNRHASKYQQALAHEKSGKFRQALKIYREIAERSADYKDIQRRIATCENALITQQPASTGASNATDRSIELKVASDAESVEPALPDPSRDALVDSLPEFAGSPESRSEQDSAEALAGPATASPKRNPPNSADEDLVSVSPAAASTSSADTADRRIEQISKMRDVGRDQLAETPPHQRIDSVTQAHADFAGDPTPNATMTPQLDAEILEADTSYADILSRQQHDIPETAESITTPIRTSPPASSSLLLYFAPLLVIPLVGALFVVPSLRAHFYLIRGNFAKAAELYEAILERNPGKTKLYQKLAKIYLLTGRKDAQAVAIYKTALQLSVPEKTKARVRALLTEHYLEQGELDSEAIKLLESAVTQQKGGKTRLAK